MAVIANLSVTTTEAVMLLVLFLGQFLIPETTVRIGFAIAYSLLFLGWLVFKPDVRRGLWKALLNVVGLRREEEPAGSA